jgi:hypothetical protein
MSSATQRAFLVCALVFVSITASAQSGPTGGLSGVVTDPSGAAIPGANIEAKNEETNWTRSTESNASGSWEIRFLPVGKYKLEFIANGFQKLVQKDIAVEAAVISQVPQQLQLGEVSETVTVNAEVPLVMTNTSSVARQIDTRELLQVPTATRSFTHLLSAEPGVSSDLPPALVNGTGNISPSVNGLRTTSNSVQYNGIDATNLSSNEGSLTDNISPSPETLEEVKLQTTLYDASVGRSGGGNFQLITRSGTNNIHGTVYGFTQNEALNANDFFFNRDGIDRPVARRHEAGGTIGGPLVRDKVFFFGGYEYATARTGFVPSAQSLSHLPSALNLISGDRTAQALFEAFRQANPASTLASPTAIDPIAVRLFNLKNPKTGEYIIPAPQGKAVIGTSTDAAGNPLTLVRNVYPAEFHQHQFTTKADYQISDMNRLSGAFFFSNFPGFDPFPDPSSLTSPFELERDDKARTFSISDIHILNSSTTNEARFGMFQLNNSRQLDPSFKALTNESIGVPNPATFFDNREATTRLGHYVFRGPRISWGGPNDTYNLRDQKSLSFADNVAISRGNHSLRLGAEIKRHHYNTNLPEEQATEFEKYASFDQLLQGFAQEADTQFGITQKSFRMTDVGWFLADDWKISRHLTLNVGMRWDWFGWPTEKNGRIGNVDLSLINDTENPENAFLVPNNVEETGFPAIDGAVATANRADNGHTLNGQDLNNFQPRFGFAYSPLGNGKLVFRGGYGVFFDRPSAGFMNTVFSNYPFLREVEVTAPSARVPIRQAFSQQNPNLPFNNYLPMRVVFIGGAAGNYQFRDGTGVTRGADGSANPIDPSTGFPVLGNTAETFEFRAVDRNLRTPYIQQWNMGMQYEATANTALDVRYSGTKGTKLLQAVAFNQGYDMNDPSTPEYIYERFNRAYVAAGSPRGPLNSGATARERGVGRAFGFTDPLTGQVNMNFGTPATSSTTIVMIPFESRAPILGFNIPEALLLQSNGNSIYHSLQLGLTRRLSHGLQFRAAYTFSKAIDTLSSDPGSTAGSGRPDVPNTGFVVQGNQRDVSSNRAVSDFDRTQRLSLSYSYDLPTFGSNSELVRGWALSGYMQAQSGSPFSIFSPEPEANTPAALAALTTGSGGAFRLGFGRPNLAPGFTLDDLRRKGKDETVEYFNRAALSSPGGGFGNLGRNVLRGPKQVRLDIALSKRTRITERTNFELRGEIFNLLNRANFALPSGDLADSEFGQITNTVGGPRSMQLGLRVNF